MMEIARSMIARCSPPGCPRALASASRPQLRARETVQVELIRGRGSPSSRWGPARGGRSSSRPRCIRGSGRTRGAPVVHLEARHDAVPVDLDPFVSCPPMSRTVRVPGNIMWAPGRAEDLRTGCAPSEREPDPSVAVPTTYVSSSSIARTAPRADNAWIRSTPRPSAEASERARPSSSGPPRLVRVDPALHVDDRLVVDVRIVSKGGPPRGSPPPRGS